MSQFNTKANEDIRNKTKLISKSSKSNKISKLNIHNNRNYSLLNISPKETKNVPYKINYANTETTYSSNNIHSNLKNGNLNIKTEQNFKKLNEVRLDSPNLKIMQNNNIKKTDNNISKYRIFSANVLKNKKRISFFNHENNNKKEAQIYLNGFIDNLLNSNKERRILSSRGFLSRAEINTEKVLKNKNKRLNTAYKITNQNCIKNLDLNLHKNNYKYSYVSMEKNQNLLQKELYYELLRKYKIVKNNNNQTNLINRTNKEHYLRSIINNITRKVQFLNTKNSILSNENTMNLLNKEEYFLYKKLKEFFKDNCSIKKFSKSIFDSKNGNKYLLPLFNEINFTYSNIEDKNKNEISKIDDDFNIYKDKIDNQNEFNHKNIIEIYLNKQLKKQRRNNYTNIFLNSNIENEKRENPNQRIIKLNKSFDKNNFEKLEKLNNINNDKIVVLKKQKKDDLKIIEKNKYQEYKMKVIQQNENIINNYHKKITYSTNAILPKKPLFEYKRKNNNIIPIKTNNKHQKKETNNSKKEDTFRSRNNIIKNKIRFSYSEKKQIKSINEIKLTKSNEKKKLINNLNKILTKNNSRIKKVETTEENKKEPIHKIARLSTKNYNETDSSKINKTAINEDIKKLLHKGNNFHSEFPKNFLHNGNLNSTSRNSNIAFYSNENTTKSKETTERKINSLRKNAKKQTSKTVETKNKKKENNLNSDLKNITISNNLILKESIENEENKLIEKIEMKKNKTLKLLYSFLKAHIKDIIEKEKIKKLLINPEFKKNFDLLKNQMNQLNELSKEDQNSPQRKSKILSDEEVIDIIYEEINKKSEKKTDENTKKSDYKASLHLKKRASRRKKSELKKEENKFESLINFNLAKENEKLELMATELTLSNELKHHIRKTFNKEFKARLQLILDKIESYQDLSAEEYVDAFKNNYSLLKEEMNEILRDKEREERINSFMNHLDSDRNIFETKWNFCKNKINVIDNKIQTSFGINEKINYKSTINKKKK